MLSLASYHRPPSRPDPGHVWAWLGAWAFHVLVCVATLSRYSHTELVFGPPDADGFSCCASSSARDGGVRMKWIRLDPARWHVVPLSGLHGGVTTSAWAWFAGHDGQPYDRPGLVAVWLFTVCPPLRSVWAWLQLRRAWFCSESIAAALGLWRPWTRSPGALHRWAVKHLPQGVAP